MRVLGIDYGTRRVGLALSDPTGLLARPWKTIAVSGEPSHAAAMLTEIVRALVSEPDGLAAIALGYPRKLNGEPTHHTAAVEALAAAVRSSIDIPVILQDERLSSHEADRELARREKDWRKRKPLLDAASAAIILQDYLDERARQAQRVESENA